MKPKLIDLPYQLIKAHVLDPENTPLNDQQQKKFDRIFTAAKILDKNPIRKNTVALLRRKYPEIGQTQAYNDVNMAVKLFNTLHTFDFDFWQAWIINSCLRNIENAQNNGTPQAMKIIAAEHANLIKAIGNKPEGLDDPSRHEKHQFIIQINLDGKKMEVDLQNLDKLPDITLRELNRNLFAGKEITVEDAKIITDS